MKRRYSQPALKKQKLQGLLIDWMFGGQGVGRVKENFQVLSLVSQHTAVDYVVKCVLGWRIISSETVKEIVSWS